MVGAKADILRLRQEVHSLGEELAATSASRDEAMAAKRAAEGAARQAELRAGDAEAKLRERSNEVASTQR